MKKTKNRMVLTSNGLKKMVSHYQSIKAKIVMQKKKRKKRITNPSLKLKTIVRLVLSLQDLSTIRKRKLIQVVSFVLNFWRNRIKRHATSAMNPKNWK